MSRGKVSRKWRKALDWFWVEVEKPLRAGERTSVRRLALLCEMAERNCWPHMSLPEVHSRRREFRRWIKKPAGFGQCFSCLDQTDREWHHIIQIQHGGPNRRDNLVKICGGCHMKVHPWLELRVGLSANQADYAPLWSRHV